MSGNSTRPNYLVFDRTDTTHPLFVVTRAVATISLEAIDALIGPGDRWLRTLDPADADWVNEVLDADSGDKTAHPERPGFATPLRRLRALPPEIRPWRQN